MKKIKLLIMMILLSTILTGCSVEYNLMVNKDTFEEEIIVNDQITQTRTKEAILKHYNKWYPTYVNYNKNAESIPLPNYDKKYEGIEYHNKEIKEISNGYQYKYSYIYDINDYYDAYILANTYSDATIQQSPKTLVLKTSKQNFLCNYDYFDSLKVNITIDPKNYEINYTNANTNNNNTYTWVINRKNCKNSQIILTLNEKENVINNDTVDKEEINIKINKYSIYIWYGIILIIVLIVYFIIRKKQKKLDDFDIDD